MNRCTSKPFLFNHSSLQETEFVQHVFLTSCFTFLFVFVWCRFVRRLLYFYKPSSKLYAGLALDHLKARQLTVVGCQFVEFLMDSDEVREVYTDARTLIYFFFLVIYEPTFVFDALFFPPPSTRMARVTWRTWWRTWYRGSPRPLEWSPSAVCRVMACSLHSANTTSSSWGRSRHTHRESNY